MGRLADDIVAASKPIRQRDLRILTLDIERLPGLAYAWEPKTRFIPAANWVRWPSLLTVAAKWYGQRSTLFHAVWGEGGREGMVAAVWELCDRADVIVGYNSVRFDMKHLRSEWLELGMPLPSPWKDADLFTEVRRSLGFESKSLDQVCARLGLPGKTTHYSIELAEAAAAGNVAAQQKLQRYNVRDVRITEACYDRLRGWLPSHPAVTTSADPDGLRCNQCGSDNLAANGWTTAVVQRYALYRCRACGANVRTSHMRRVSNVRGAR